MSKHRDTYTKIYNCEFIFMIIYITGKLFWDQIPYFFELIFWFIVFLNSVEYIISSVVDHRSGKILFFSLFFTLYIILNGILQDKSVFFVRSLYEYIAYYFVFLFFLRLRTYIDLILCLKIGATWGIIISCLTWYEYLTHTYLLRDLSEYANTLSIGMNGFRAAVFSRSFLSHGVVLGVFSIIDLYVYSALRKKRYLIASLFAFLSILATGSRGPLVSFFCSLFFFYYVDSFYVRKNNLREFIFLLLLFISLITLLVVLSMNVNPSESPLQYFIYRIQNIFNWNGDAGNVGRISIWKNSLEDWFLKSPLWGIGPSKTGSWGESSLGVTESGVLKRFCELGIIGAVLFYSLIIFIIRGCTRIQDELHKKELIFWLSIFVGIFINDMIVQSTEEIMVSFWYWCSLGGVFYLKTHKTKSYTQT